MEYDNITLILSIIFPLIGFLFLALGYWLGLKTINILLYGLPATGTLTRILPGEDVSTYQLIFRFITQDGRNDSAILRTANMKPAWRDFLEHNRPVPDPLCGMASAEDTPESAPDKPQELVLYNAENPTDNLLLVEYGYRFDDNGDVVDPKPVNGYLSLIVPMLTVVGHGWYVVSQLLR